MLQYVHLDEKWFYITKVSRKYYLVPGEKEPKREFKSKGAGTLETKSVVVTKDVYRTVLLEKVLPAIVA
ncbi:hypothetical protein H310_01198 [Aphanomyces invadans]|uniref:Uncharacterized protein n=1 Tax=Aphanomyces invadans TaxID=157072 RepID=A0A024US10_9STRA|nr:hypothetical protein H310_01198 [Aphanomyces invadans]ETW08667.1 hypothetical protein H310_01198 [Aphanomyces invadans]|eukprot:XP_008862472.1 hypothetical protein H310_01198 [Aphanomyces invadans]